MRDLHALEALLRGRRHDPPPGSYSATLVADPEHAARKIMEEAYELCVELTRPDVDAGRATEEAADLVFHLLAGLVAVDVDLDAVLAELDTRHRARQDAGQADGRLRTSPSVRDGGGAVPVTGAGDP